MRLSLLETDFWIGGALRTRGLPYGALKPAIRMVQWRDAFAGDGCRRLMDSGDAPMACDAARIEIVRDEPDVLALDAEGQSAFVVGPAALDLAMARAESGTRGLVTVRHLSEAAWLPALAETAASRGFSTILTCQAEEGRAVLATPGTGGAPWWMEMACATPLHDSLMEAEPLPALNEIGRRLASPASGRTPGAALLCLRLSEAEQGRLRQVPLLLGQAAGARLISPADYARRWQEVEAEGFEIDDSVWQALSALALTTVIEGSEASRLQAGADG